jgi:hypothetical protein
MATFSRGASPNHSSGAETTDLEAEASPSPIAHAALGYRRCGRRTGRVAATCNRRHRQAPSRAPARERDRRRGGSGALVSAAQHAMQALWISHRLAACSAEITASTNRFLALRTASTAATAARRETELLRCVWRGRGRRVSQARPQPHLPHVKMPCLRLGLLHVQAARTLTMATTNCGSAFDFFAPCVLPLLHVRVLKEAGPAPEPVGEAIGAALLTFVVAAASPTSVLAPIADGLLCTQMCRSVQPAADICKTGYEAPHSVAAAQALSEGVGGGASRGAGHQRLRAFTLRRVPKQSCNSFLFITRRSMQKHR